MKSHYIISFLLSLGVIKCGRIICSEEYWESDIDSPYPLHGECTLKEGLYAPGDALKLEVATKDNYIYYELQPYSTFNLYHPQKNNFNTQDLISFKDSDTAYHAITYYIENKKGYTTICTPLDCLTLKQSSPLYLVATTISDRLKCQRFIEIGPDPSALLFPIQQGICIEDTRPSTPYYTTLPPNKKQHSLFYISTAPLTGYSIINHSLLTTPQSINSGDTIPLIPSSLAPPSSLSSSTDSPHHIFQVKDFSHTISNYPFFSVSGSLSPLVPYSNRFFLITTPRRVYSLVMNGKNLSLLEDTERSKPNSLDEKKDKSSFLLLQVFSKPLVLPQEDSDAIRYSALPRHSYGYEKRKGVDLVTGVRAFQQFVRTEWEIRNMRLKKENTMGRGIESMIVENCEEGESYLFSYSTAVRNEKQTELSVTLQKMLRERGIRDWDWEGQEGKGEEKEGEDWEGSVYWVRGEKPLDMDDVYRDIEERRRKAIIANLALAFFSVGFLVAMSLLLFFKMREKARQEALLSDNMASTHP